MTPIRMSKWETAVRVALDFHEAFNRHDVPSMMALMSEDCLFENTEPGPDGAVYSGKDSVARFWEEFFAQSPQARIEIEEVFGAGSRCIMRWRYEWVEEGGQRGYVRGVDLFKVEDNLITEKLSYVKG